MPTYEYKCSACGHMFERFQKISARPIRTCPECGKRRVRRLISSGGGVVFKGSGFYATDYRKEAPGPREGPKSTSDSTEGRSPAKQGESGDKKGEGGDA